MVVAGGLAAGLAPFAARAAGAQETPSFGGAGTDPSTDPGLTTEGSDTVPPEAAGDYGFLPPRPASEKHVRPMMFPVLADATLGKATWSDTYLAPRGGGRRHEGQDLMGNKMLKLLAVVSGTIVELRHQSSGNSLYLKGDDGWYYCYLHINNDDPGTDNGANQFKYAYAPGMATGKRVLKGDLLGYLGDSGNAEATGAHLHFEIRMPNERWYNAAAVNAAYSLNAAEPAKVRPKVPNSAFAPLPDATTFAKQQVADFLGIIPSAAFVSRATENLEGGAVTPDRFTADMLNYDGATKQTAPTIRLYLGFFLRIPDYRGLDYWIRKVRAGTPLDTAASQFAAGSEFIRRYGDLDNTAYVTQLYRNLFDRAPDASGLDYWKRRLDGGAKRGWVMRQLCESPEYQRKTSAQVKVIQIHAAMVKAAPTAAEYKRWTDWVNGAGTTGVTDLVKYLRTGAAYNARF
jgi:murein DD-endopeptidase MepM/ murein hydrolase activator NlpD